MPKHLDRYDGESCWLALNQCHWIAYADHHLACDAHSECLAWRALGRVPLAVAAAGKGPDLPGYAVEPERPVAEKRDWCLRGKAGRAENSATSRVRCLVNFA